MNQFNQHCIKKKLLSPPPLKSKRKVKSLNWRTPLKNACIPFEREKNKRVTDIKFGEWKPYPLPPQRERELRGFLRWACLDQRLKIP